MAQAGLSGKVLLLSEIKAHCRIEAERTEEDDLLLQMEAAAVRSAESIIRGPLLERECMTVLPGWPASPCLLLPVAAPRRVSEILVMVGGRQHDWADYRLIRDDLSPAGRVKPVGAWPQVDDVPDAVVVRYVAGIAASADDVPDDIKQWLRFRVATFFEYREMFVAGASVTDLPGGFVDCLLDNYVLREVVL